MNRTILSLAAGIVMTLGSAAHAAQASWDAVGDFNIMANPNGAWSYNWQFPTGPLTLMAFGQHDCDEAGSDCWNKYGGTNYLPQIAKNVSGAEIQNACCVYPLSILNMHPGASGERAVLTWTAPATGTYVISGQYQIEDHTPTGVEVFVTQGSTVLLDKVLASFARVAQFHYKRAIAAGEQVSFLVDAHGNYASDSTALHVGILLVP
jgi:acetyltransferase-like isoleucine patch superfamily enzyme